MKAHYLQHVPFEGLGSIEEWLKNAGYQITKTQLFTNDVLPEIADIDFLIVMGGPMSVNDEIAYPWLVKEKQFIKNIVESGKPVLGICLGAQLIAHAMGAKIYPNPLKEIGWFPIESVVSDDQSVFQFPEETPVFHWHGETFELPESAVHLAKSEGCKHQAFQIGERVIGLQFHMETTPLSAKAIVENCRDELVDGKYIQAESKILAASQEQYLSINRLMAAVLEYLQANHYE